MAEYIMGEEIPNDVTTKDLEIMGIPSLTPSYLPEVHDENEDILILSPIEREVAMSVAEGKSFKAIAVLLDVDVSVVKTIRNRQHVRKFIKDYVGEVTVKAKERREEILAQIIEARLNNLDENMDMSSLSKRDTADLIEMLDRLQKEREKAELGANNQQINILQILKKD